MKSSPHFRKTRPRINDVVGIITKRAVADAVIESARTCLRANSFEFWFMMQIAMLCGFVTSYPANWWLLRTGIKEKT